jgi:hypothetical protein
MKPNADGNYSQWTPSSGSGADHYADVDEVPASDADYLTEDAVGQKDSFAMETYSIGTNEIVNAVIPIIRAKKNGATEALKIGTRYSGTDLMGANKDLGVSFGYLSERQTTKPGGGAWDQAAVDDMEVVIQSSGSF